MFPFPTPEWFRILAGQFRQLNRPPVGQLPRLEGDYLPPPVPFDRNRIPAWARGMDGQPRGRSFRSPQVQGNYPGKEAGLSELEGLYVAQDTAPAWLKPFMPKPPQPLKPRRHLRPDPEQIA